MSKKITLEELMMPLIDDAANVFYSKLVSLLDAMWGQMFVLKSWCGWHNHRRVGFKWKYGAFSSYKTDRKCVIDLNEIDPILLKKLVEKKKPEVKKSSLDVVIEKITERSTSTYLRNLTDNQRETTIAIIRKESNTNIAAMISKCDVLDTDEKIVLAQLLFEAGKIDSLDAFVSEHLDNIKNLKKYSGQDFSEESLRNLEMFKTLPSILSGDVEKSDMTVRMALLLIADTKVVQETTSTSASSVEYEEKPVTEPLYLRAVYKMDMSKILVDTTESVSNTGGAPVPTYRIDTDAPLILLGYTVSTRVEDFLYGDGIGNHVAITYKTDGQVSSLVDAKTFMSNRETSVKRYRPFITVLVGHVSLFAGRCIEFSPIYRNGMLDDETFKINKKTTIYAHDMDKDVSLLSTNDVSQGTKYEWDCGRAIEYCLDGDNGSRFWKYYSVDSDGTLWLLESSERPKSQTPEVMLPFLNNVADTDYFLKGACFKKKTIDAIKKHYILYVWKMSSHVFPLKNGEMFFKFTPRKMHKRKVVKVKDGKEIQVGLKKYEIDKLSKQTNLFLYERHDLTLGVGLGAVLYKDILSSIFSNSLFFEDVNLCSYSAYDIGKNYTDKVVDVVDADYVMLLISAVMNVSMHYLFNGRPSDSLSYPVYYDYNKASSNAIPDEAFVPDIDYLLNVTKYTSFISNMRKDDKGFFEDASWDKVVTPYIFVKDATRADYASSGGTLVKFVNLGTEEEPKFYMIERRTHTKGDYGVDTKDHEITVNLWTKGVTHKYTPTYQTYSIPGMFAEGFSTHYKGRIMDVKVPTQTVYRQLYCFYENMVTLFSTDTMGGETLAPRKKSAYVRNTSFTLFLENANRDRLLRLKTVTDTVTGFTYLSM